MFSKLSFEELSKFYGALSELEKHYGKEEVHKAVKRMANMLDHGEIPNTGGILPKQMFPDLGKIIENIKPLPFKPLPFSSLEPVQLSFDTESQKRKRRFAKRKRAGENDSHIKEFCEKFAPELTPEEVMLDFYYKRRYTQSEIANIIGGVNQRAVGKFIEGIPQRRMKEILSGWGVENEKADREQDQKAGNQQSENE